MGNTEFEKRAIKAVVKWYNEHCDGKKLCQKDVYVVWMCKALQNNKALLSTVIDDGRYYEFTWNGDKNEGYLDVYVKEDNCVIPA